MYFCFSSLSIPPLSMSVTETLSSEEKATLKKNALSLLNNIHSRGVYHGDVSVENILCKREGMKITILGYGACEGTKRCRFFFRIFSHYLRYKKLIRPHIIAYQNCSQITCH